MPLEIRDVETDYTVDEVTGDITFHNADGTVTVMKFDHDAGEYVTEGKSGSTNADQFGQAFLKETLTVLGTPDAQNNAKLVALAASAASGDSATHQYLQDYANSLQNYSRSLGEGAASTAAQGQLWRDLANGMAQNQSGLSQHLDARGQALLEQAAASSRQAAAYSELASNASSNANSIDMKYKNLGAALDAVQLLSALSEGSTDSVMKATLGVAAGMLIGGAAGLLGAPIWAGIAIGIGVGFVADALYDKYLSDHFKDRGNFWDNLFDSLGLDPTVNENFNNARKFVPRRDPLTLDLDGDGIETVGAHGSTLFDHDGDGVRSGTGWVSADDGFLVFDRNKNGLIDDGSELFGVDTIRSDGSNATSGFSALADLDSDKNGIFDSRDVEFSNVRVWRDLNQDGVSQSAELFKLADLGVASIGLVPTMTEDLDLGNGNVVDNRGAYTRIDGTVGLAGDLQLAMNNYFRDFSGSLDKVEVSYEASRLPGVKGSGAVRDLKEAATLSTQLLASIQALVPGTSRDAMKSSLDTILARWAATSAMQSSEEMLESSVGAMRNLYYRGTLPASIAVQGQEAVDAWIKQQHSELGPMIAILEKFNGSSLISYRNDQVSTGGNTYTWSESASADGATAQVMNILLQPEQIESIKAAYGRLKDSVYSGLVMQTRLKNYLDSVSVQFANGDLEFYFDKLTALLDAKLKENQSEAFQDLTELNAYAGRLISKFDFVEILGRWIDAAKLTSSGIDAMTSAGIHLVDGAFIGTSSHDVFWGGVGADSISGGNGNDVIRGHAGNDSVSGDGGDDLLLGDAGDDVLQ
ncbi:hypothetical protein VDF70_19890, partial [Xanthomonas campestris pv. raphani]|uniref:hypothetical protein n=1 Tax=Xanthomonas campestris TaxID=339 RepID=UPI002B238810